MSGHRDGVGRRDGIDEGPSSIPEIGRTLRRARTRQGLRPDDVFVRIGVTAGEIEVLEGGTVAQLPDQVSTVRALRRYADFLGLPGEQYALALVELWPFRRSGLSEIPLSDPSTTVNRLGAGDATGVVAATVHQALADRPTSGSSGPHSTEEIELAAIAAAGGPVTLSHPTVAVGRPGLSDAALDGDQGVFDTGQFNVGELKTGQLAVGDFDTGMIPAVHPRTSRARPRSGSRGTATALRVSVGLVAFLVALGASGLAANHYRPQWLADLHLPHSPIAHSPLGTHPLVASPPTTSPTVGSPPTSAPGHTPPAHRPPAAHPASKGRSGKTGSSARQVQSGRSRHAAPKAPAFAVDNTNPNAPVLRVGSTAFLAVVSAAGGPSWVQGSVFGDPATTFAQTLGDGESHDFLVKGALSLELGSSAGRVAVVVGNRQVGTYSPTAAPVTLTIESQR